jgi:DNA-directed RNA polymerase specialized sigma24 family protein
VQPDADPTLLQQCEGVVDAFIARFDWQIATRDELVARTLQNMQSQRFETPKTAAMGAYCAVLYTASSGTGGAGRQNRAFEELGRYLYASMRQRYADLPQDLWADVTQTALMKVHQNLSRCREPDAFLMFALHQLRDAVNLYRRAAQHDGESLERALGADQPTIAEPVDSAPSAFEQVAEREISERVERLLQAFVRRRPRARLQILVVRATILGDRDAAAIARQYGTSLNSIYSTRSRALKALRDDPEMRSLAVELGIIAPPLAEPHELPKLPDSRDLEAA